MKFSAPPYMHDVLPSEPARDGWLHVARWRALEAAFRSTCQDFGYRELRTPVMETTDLFARSIGAGTDIVSKEMFTFEDRGGRSMTLRPEGTAPAIRAYLEHGLGGERAVSKLYYIATIYRYERGQRGRYREHQQTGIEAIGSQDPALDAEVIGLAIEFYRRLGIDETELRLNSVGCPVCRPAYREALVAFAQPLADAMSADNRVRLHQNPLRMLDSKDERDREVLAGAPALPEFLCNECDSHFTELQSLLAAVGIAYRLDAHLVRGFDYYTKTAFEIVSPHLGAQNVLGGGGRYDGLVEECGGPPTPGIGLGIGTERCLIVLDQLGVKLQLEDERPDVVVVTVGAVARREGVRLLMELRKAGLASDMDYSGKSVKSQMRHADRSGAALVALLGDEELESGMVTVRPLRAGGDQVKMPRADAVRHICALRVG
ncbi:MAG TPA: histidine--tRNA ligase [Chthonomonadales bacterium]|nr:histidine--tRNA ligase [Chthonomonadales bacterium]